MKRQTPKRRSINASHISKAASTTRSKKSKSSSRKPSVKSQRRASGRSDSRGQYKKSRRSTPNSELPSRSSRNNTSISSRHPSHGVSRSSRRNTLTGAHQFTASDLGRQRMADGVWTKDGNSPSKRKAGSSTHKKGSSEHLIISVIGNGFKSLLGIILTFFVRHRIFRVFGALVLAALIFYGVDTVLNYGKIYPGVSVGNVDLSGMTVQEATDALENEYREHVNNNVTVFFADEQALQNAVESEASENLQEQLSYEQSLETRRQWTTTPTELGGAFSSGDFAQQAFEVGRNNGGLIKRIECIFSGVHTQPSMTFNDGALSDLSQSITSSIGTFRENSAVQIDGNRACATEGHDGEEATTEWLTSQLNASIFGDNDHNDVIVELQHVPMQITLEQAQQAADVINNSTSQGIHFTYESSSWDASQSDVLSLVTTEVVQNNGTSFSLQPIIDEEKAKSVLLNHFPSSINEDDLQVTFEKDSGNNIQVSSNATGTIPEISKSVDSMNETFFVKEQRSDKPTVEIPSTGIPSTLSFNDALSYGIIEEVSSFTTEYAQGVEARNFNIHLMSDRLSNSIIKANGGTWSFIDTSGPISEDNGYKNAGAILAGQYSDAIGGGVCQVATTVFNSVYNAGFPVLERHNHSLYIASYPEGRDAAITDSDPQLDLRWENDSTSDLLLVMTYTDSSVTATLYGVSPNYQVSTEVGEWEEGEPYSTRYITDETLSKDDEVIQQNGSDGRSITVIRTVTDTDGKVLHQDTFSSTYSAKDEIIARGPSE